MTNYTGSKRRRLERRWQDAEVKSTIIFLCEDIEDARQGFRHIQALGSEIGVIVRYLDNYTPKSGKTVLELELFGTIANVNSLINSCKKVW